MAFQARKSVGWRVCCRSRCLDDEMRYRSCPAKTESRIFPGSPTAVGRRTFCRVQDYEMDRLGYVPFAPVFHLPKQPFLLLVVLYHLYFSVHQRLN